MTGGLLPWCRLVYSRPAAVAEDKQKSWWLVALGLVLTSLLFALAAKLLLEPEAVETPSPRVEQVARPAATAVVPEPIAEAPASAPAPPSTLASASPPPVEPAEDRVPCSRAADCRGAKTADCVVASCEAGRCVFDRSRCECVDDAECDDGIECTRDLCFAATKKCIHIRSACD